MSRQSVNNYISVCRSFINQNGFMIQGVGPDSDLISRFSYTVGMNLRAFQLPELVVVGLPLSTSVTLLTHAVERHISKTISDGELIPGWTTPVRAHEIDSRPLTVARLMQCTLPTAIQLVWPDADGHYHPDQQQIPS